MAQKNLQTHPKNLLPEKTVFTMFMEEEIRKLAVKKIVTSMTFDAFGHPIPGGLHDKALGPLKDNGEFCETCNKMMIACPGHFGYIDIPLPVANPLFSKYIYILLRMTCLQCFNIQLPLHVKHSFRVQMKLLNCGLVTEALEVEEKVAAILSQYDSFEKIPEDIVLPTKEYEDLADNLIASGELKTELNNKNVEALRLKAVDTLVKSYKTRRACMSCNEAMSRISFLRGKLIMSLSHLKHYKVERIPKESGAVKENNSKFITPEESRRYLRSIYEANQDLLKFLFPVLTMVESEYPTDIFYFSVVPVTPSCTRPVNFVNNMLSEHPLTKLYKNILQNAMILRIAIQIVKNDGDLNSVKAEARDLYHMALGASPVEKMNTLWEQLQTDVNNLVDSSMIRNNDFQGGLKQIIEKKKGIIRQHMMGKRVNYAARSVIAPDPNLNIEEVGIPEEFAKTLTFPVPVTTWNVEEMRKLILNGPNVHPGANMIEYENGVIVRINPKDTVQQESIMKRLLTPGETNFRGPKYVYRHLVTGDVLLVNRQPTLHKPSIMAHTARILKGEKTLRLHYANCKAYNADFDGDEMNAHFPQNEVCRSEAYNLANVGNQFLVPKDGTPLSGLIQDHVISGVALSMRGKFFNKSDYHELVYQALGFKAMHIKLLPPAMLKPQVLWSGKQVLSTIIINIIPEGKELINLTANAKISSKAWETEKPRPWKAGGTPFKNDNYMTEAEVIIRGGELLCGVLDKTHYGATPYGLVHCIYELYGGNYATRLLSSFAKVFTFNLQRRGFTLGTADILVTEKANKKRTKIIERCRKSGIEAITNAISAPIDTPVDDIVVKVNENYAQNPKFRSIIDRNYKSCLDSYTNEINKVCIPSGLEQTFPKNNLQLMVQSGAKGSTVNTMQISCLLGQIELEGKRPPIMLSGKGLPSFPEFEFAPRAGGFVDGRFMTGIKNQEFFFHCMAGREGLIDTAVKTSRSGYLQRCLVKHLEGLKVGYDMTVRDSDGSVIQFQYGEDGMDIVKAQFLNKKQIPVLKENIKAIVDKAMIDKLKQDEDNVKLMNHEEKINEWVKQHGDPLKKKRNSAFTMFSQIMSEQIEGSKLSKMDKKSGRSKKARKLLECWKSLDADSKKQYEELSKKCPDPLSSEYQPDVHFGAMNERLYSLMQNAGIQKKKLKKEFENMLKLKSMQSLANPGEPVGLLAAQSIGEPSTQMTLNTFHFAGRGEMNVTLGIPRLREILMMASKNIKTPSMEIPFLKVPNMEKKAERLRKTLTKVVVSDVLEKIDVSIENQFNPERLQMYVLRFHFLPYEAYETEYCVKPKYIIKHMTSKFFKLMFTAIQKVSKIQMQAVVIKDDRESNKKKNQGSDDEDNQDEKGEGQKGGGGDESSDSELEDEEDAKQTNKFQQAHDDQEPEVEEMEQQSDDDGESEKEQFAKKVNIEETLLEEEAEEDELSAVQNDVVNRYSLARSYTYDKKKHLWCEIGFALPINFKKFDLSSLLRDIASKSVLWEIPLIKRAITYKKDDQLMLRTDGINITEMAKYYSILDLNKLYCNDIHQISQTYGIEAASKAIVKEVQDVFKVYGITVDPRHLSLVADYMTFNGSFEPLNRRGIESSVSPLHQMSFESSLTFLKGSLIQGKEDFLKTPSSCLFLGKPCNTGTGTFSLLAKLRA